jgi:hypothetical protein
MANTDPLPQLLTIDQLASDQAQLRLPDRRPSRSTVTYR